MTYDNKTDTVTLSTGKSFYADGDALTPNGPGSICYGSDGGESFFRNPLTATEAQEIYDGTYILHSARKGAVSR